MAVQVSYQSQQCNSCGGRKLEYNPQTKVWVCQYCGNTIERVEQTDSIFGIKNVIRQVLQDVAYRRMSSALENIAESEKIDVRYVGTVQAALAYEVCQFNSGQLSPNEQRNLAIQIKKRREQLLKLGDAPSEEEIALYDALDSDEAIAVLVVAMNFVRLSARRDYLLSRLDASQIYSLDLNTELLQYALESENWELFDVISNNTENIRTNNVAKIVLAQYPDGEQKREHIKRLIESGRWSQDDREMFTGYFNESKDDPETLLAVAIAISLLPCRPNIECFMTRLVARLTTTEQVMSFLNVITSKPLLDVEIATILNYAMNDCSDEVCISVLTRFYETEQFLELDHNHLFAILKRPNAVTSRVSFFETALKFQVKNNAIERAVSMYLCEIGDDASRREMLAYLLEKVKSLPTATVETYLMDNTKDAGFKEEIVRLLFSMDINRAFFRETISKYLLHSNDDEQCKQRILKVMIEAGLPVTATSCVSVLKSSMSSEEKITLLRRMREGGLRYDDVVNEYAGTCGVAQFDQAVFSELVLASNQISEATLIRYVLVVPSVPQTKASLVMRMRQACFNPPAKIGCQIQYLGSTVICNIVQAYLLMSPETTNEAAVVLEALAGNDEWINDITVDGKRVKFKRYLASQKHGLSPVTVELCARYRLL